MSSMLTKLWRTFTETPSQRRERKRRKREARDSDSSSASSSDSERDESGLNSIVVGGRTLRRTAERTARAANQPPERPTRSRAPQQPQTGRENNEPQNIEDYFTSDSSIPDIQNGVSNVGLSVPNNSPIVTDSAPSTPPHPSPGSLELVRVRPIRHNHDAEPGQVSRLLYVPSVNVPVSRLPNRNAPQNNTTGIYPSLTQDARSNMRIANQNEAQPTASNSQIKVSKKASNIERHPAPSAPSPDHDLFEESPTHYNIHAQYEDSPERFTVSPFNDTDSSSSNNDNELEHLNHENGGLILKWVSQPSHSDAYHAKQVIIAGHRNIPSSRGPVRSHNGQSMTAPVNENDGERHGLPTRTVNSGPHNQSSPSGHQITGERVVCIPSSNHGTSHKINHEISQAAIPKSEPNYESGEFDQSIEDEFLRFIDPIRKLLFKNGSSNDYRSKNGTMQPGDPHDSPPSSSSDESDADTGRRRNGHHKKNKNSRDNNRKKKTKRRDQSDGEDDKESDGGDKPNYNKNKNGKKRKGKKPSGGDGGDSSPSDSSDDSSSSDGTEDDSSGDENRKSKKKGGKSIQTINIVGMHGNVPDLEPFYNSEIGRASCRERV